MSSLFIPEPCHENWGKMSPTEQGRFCAVCTKEVMDFTRKNEAEILQHLKEADGKTCGRFLPEQLDLKLTPHNQTSKKETRIKRWAISLLAIGGLFSLQKEAQAQKMGKVAVKGEVKAIETHNTNTQTSVVYGQVLNMDNKGVSGAYVSVYSGTELIAETKTMANGTFRIELLPGKIINGKISVHASHINRYRSLEDITITKESTRLSIRLEETYAIMGDVAYVEPEQVIKETTIDSLAADTLSTLPVVCESTPERIQEEEKIQEEIRSFSIEESTKIHFTQLYPNSGSSYLNIQLEQENTSLVEVYNLEGKLMLSAQYSSSFITIDTPGFSPGTYIIRIVSDGKTDLHKWIKMAD